ncbi:MAG: amino acid ABC transporter ATP-binding protein [Candidatus Rokubacteria bacterium]|nr:amino acid ABC transporter ATP-binding protein [Candidatus Rokubacteria bacterium]MBI3105877.1 amino acid ABC transporter ATP-binding protein [Candidatus Rokubacteria bacterium]
MIEFQGVSKWYGTRPVLAGIDLEVRAGEVVVVCGPSGSGKSTLLRCVNGLEPVQRGRVIVDGVPLDARGTDLLRLRASIGMVFQAFNLYPHMTALDNIALAPVIVRRQPRARAVQDARGLLAKVGIPDKAEAYPSQLSGGQQQRVAIARALAMEPKIILFDEPTSALDPEMIDEVLEVIVGLAREGMTMLVVTHEMGFARRVAGRVVFLDGGRVAEDAPSAGFFARTTNPRVQAFLSKILVH